MSVSRPTDLASQWALSPRGVSVPGAEKSLDLPSFTLSWFDPMPVNRVLDARGQHVGALVGHAVDYTNRRVLKTDFRLSESIDGTCSSSELDALVERDLYSLSGSWIFILDCPAARRLYLDADGTLSAVWDSETRRVAATAALLLDAAAYADRFEAGLYSHLGVQREGWFPGGLTAHSGVERILVNHYLDLETWSQHRHWPSDPIRITEDPNTACLSVARVARETIESLRAEGPISLSLTGGNETRFLLACAREQAEELEFVTLVGPETKMDTHLAGQLAKRANLNHTLLPVVHANADGQELWHARTGHCMGGANMLTHPSIAPMAERAYFVVGLGGEIGRGFFWRDKDNSETQVTAKMLERRMGMPAHDRVRESVAKWLKGVEGFDPFLQLDLAYLELRMGCWGYALSYVSPHVNHISPMISRESYTAMLSLPPEWRRNNRMITHTIETLWGDLMAVPINKYGDLRDYTEQIQRAIAHPHLITKKLRKMLG